MCLVDNVSKKTRSRIMASIRGKDTTPEMLLRKHLRAKGVYFKSHTRARPTAIRPDIVFARKKVCVFIDGCFWHKCPKCFTAPQSNRGYWGPKLDRNVKRDLEQADALKSRGWRVLRCWEHEIRKDPGKIAARIGKIIEKRNRHCSHHD
jgi:DNA mismatch endonuclease, patch repair protein